LVGRGAVVRAYDPTVAVDWDDAPAGVEIVGGPLDACNGADVLAVLTEWDEFRTVNPRAVGEQMENRAVVDARNCLDRALWQRHGFDYRGIGR
jgi:UDPglucose 6-dehydrogenase